MERPTIALPKEAVNFSWKNSLLTLQKLQVLHKERWVDKVDIKVKTTGIPYFLFMPLSDFHIGAKGTDYKALKSHLELIKNYGVSTILLGDMGDFFSPTVIPSGMMDDVVNPNEQAEIIRSFFKEYREGILSVVSGNHEGWNKKTSGFDLYTYLASELEIPLLNSGGVVNIKVDKERYRLRLFHKVARLNSQFNYTHAGKQALRLGGIDNLDMVISGDKHLGAVETTTYGDKKVIVAQLGTFKTNDPFGKDIGMPQKPTIFFPIFALDGRQHNIEYFSNPTSAVEFYETMNKGIKNRAVAMLGIK